MADQLVGQRFGGYEILEEVGRGGMAVVYKARQISMNRIVAVKVLPRQFAHDQTFRARFEREVAIVATLEHRAIVPVHDYGEVDEMPYIVMRYMDAGNVDDLLAQGPLPPLQVEKIVRQIADGLDYAHTKGVLHRDLKPSNILLDEAGDAYLTDFGIAYITLSSSKITTSGVVGTPAYMSPEQAQGLKLDGRSDVYGLAVVTFEMLTARRPYESDTPYGIAVMHVTAPIPSALDANPALSPAVDQVLRRGLAKNRAERYQTAAGFATALTRAIHATADEIAESTAQTKPVDLQEARQRMAEEEAAHVSAPVRSGPDHPRRDQQPTPPSSARVRRARPRVRASSRTWLLSILLGGLLGCGLFAVALALASSLLGAQNPPPTATPTPSPTVAGGTVVPQRGPLHPAAQALTATAEAAPTPTPMGDPLEALDETGGRIVFYAGRDGQGNELYLLDLLTGLEVRLTDNDADDLYPAVSPDGSRLAFMSDRDGDYEIFLMDLSCVNGDQAASCEESVTQLTDNEVEDRTPAWTPDGDSVLYASDDNFNGQHNLYRLDLNNSDPVALTDDDDRRDGHPVVSPDGRYVVFHAWTDDNIQTGAILRLDLESGEVETLFDGEGNDWSPSYSPDGGLIAFHREGEGRAGLWVMDADGQNPREVYDGPGYDWGSSWSPDGRLLTFTSDESGMQEIYLIEPEDGEPRKITSDGGEYPSWIP